MYVPTDNNYNVIINNNNNAVVGIVYILQYDILFDDLSFCYGDGER